ncbi:MAG: phospholipase D-like domain-containing protein [Bdellovibrionota bacterium]
MDKTTPVSLLTLSLLALSGCSHTARVPSSAGDPAPGLYVNGSQSLNPALKLVQGAKKSIDIEIYEMEDAPFINAVRAKLKDGVTVRIIKDPYPVPKADQCIWFPGLREGDPDWAKDPKQGDQTNMHAQASCGQAALPMIAEIRAKGGQVVPFYKPHLCGQDERPDNDGSYCYEHGKMIIVDGRIALVSSGNFNAANFCDKSQNPDVCNRDFSYITTDTSRIGVLSAVFEKDLQQNRYPLHPIVDPGSSQNPDVTASPYSLAPLVNFIQKNAMGPGHRLQVANQYLKEKNLNAAIQAAAKSGAKVEVMVASLCSFGRPAETAKAQEQDLYNSFKNSGAQLKYFPAGISVQGNKGYLHAKAFVIDGKLAWMGSVNGSNSALNTNREFGLFFQDADSVRTLSDTLNADFTDPNAQDFDQSWACTNGDDPNKAD